MSFTQSKTFSQIAPGKPQRKIQTKANCLPPRGSTGRKSRPKPIVQSRDSHGVGLNGFYAQLAENQTKANLLRPSGKLSRKNTNQSQTSEPRLVARQFLIPKSNQSQFPPRIHPFELSPETGHK